MRQGGLLHGVATQARRLHGQYDESNPADMVEYHVVRKGVDEESIARLLGVDFEKIELMQYWSNQSGAAQRLGKRLSFKDTFGLVASGRLG